MIKPGCVERAGNCSDQLIVHLKVIDSTLSISWKFEIPTLHSSGIANLRDESRTGGWFTPAALVIGKSKRGEEERGAGGQRGEAAFESRLELRRQQTTPRQCAVTFSSHGSESRRQFGTLTKKAKVGTSRLGFI